MEPVGLAVGIVGLAGLYTACLDLLERFDSWKEFGTDSKSLSALFNAEKLRLRQWGDAAGFDRENLSLSQSHHKALDNPQTLSIVKELLSAIKDVVNDGENFPCEPDSTHDKEKGSAKRNTHPGAGRESKRGKLRWALGKKGKRVAQVEQFGSLVEKLCNLVPTNIPSGWEELDGELIHNHFSS